MTKNEKIKLLTDDTKTDAEVALLLGLSASYLPILRNRWSIKKKRGNKEGSIKSSTLMIDCATCGKSIRKTKCDIDRKYCSRSCMYQSEEYRKKLSVINRDYMLTEEYSLAMSKEDTPEYRKYANKVQTLTRKTTKPL